MNYENYFTKPFAKMSTLQLSAYGGGLKTAANIKRT